MHPARLTILVTALIVLAIAGCGGGVAKVPAASNAAAGNTAASVEANIARSPASGPLAATSKPADPIVVLHTTAGDVKLQLFADKSPQTVDNFLNNYSGRGFYEQTIFHHVEPGSMIIGGGYTADLEPKLTRTPIFNESRNGLSNRRGTVAMIRDPDSPHTATSQFFVNLADHPDLDFQSTATEDQLGYCVFGEVIEGLDVVERIAGAPTTAHGDFANVPKMAAVIQSVERLR